MTPPHPDVPSHKGKRSASFLWAKLTILLQKISDSTYLPNWAPPYPFSLPKFLKYHLSLVSILVQKRAVHTWPMCLQMCCHGLCFPVCVLQLFTQSPTTSPTFGQWCLKEWMPVGFSWHKHKVPLGSFLDPLHVVYCETKAMPADCIKSKGRLWAKPGKRPPADSGTARI